MQLLVRASELGFSGEGAVEIVERKGLGHPDTMCDGIAEHISRALCREYQRQFGAVLHHNVDKVLLVAGSSQPRFGGGEVTKPLEIYLAGRAASQVEGRHLDVDEIAVEACRDWLRRYLRHLDVDRHVHIVPKLRSGSTDLTALFGRGRTPLANDTSCGVGFAPLSELERLVLRVEHTLNSCDTKEMAPAIGEDIKVLGFRVHDKVHLTIGCAIVAQYVDTVQAYLETKRLVRQLALDTVEEHSPFEVQAIVNAGDDVDHGDVYLTVTGTSAESGDDGEVGRGNRCNGLITPYRPMTLEAVAGKNPVNHVGKLYNLICSRAARRIAAECKTSVSCSMVSQIGKPVTEPSLVDVQLSTQAIATEAYQAVTMIVADELSRIDELRRTLLDGLIDLC